VDKRLGVGVREPSPRYREKICAATIAGSFAKASQLLKVLSNLQVSPNTVQRQSEAMGERIREWEDQGVESYRNGGAVERGKTKPKLLVITTDGGRVQTRGTAAEGKWKENKVGVIYTAEPTPEKAGEKYHGPAPQERTCVATMRNWDEMADMLSWEAERRNWRSAQEVVMIGDGGAGVKGVWQTAFATIPFILDWAHAMEHVHACAAAAYATESERKAWSKKQEEALWEGRVLDVQREIARLSKKKGEPPPGAAETDARLILKRNAAYFRENAPHMDYPTDRRKGWPIGSGIVESCVKQFGKRVKGTEKFWSMAGAESTLALLSYFFSEDGRWNRFWNRDILFLQSAA
jgi:hypothetical protein